MMTYQVLVSTMNRNDLSIYDEMNIRSDAILINQCDSFDYEEQIRGNHKIKMYSFPERGVGLSRNSALMRSEADIVEFADDDMVFSETHENDVLREFEKHPEADAILFSIKSLNPERPLLKIDSFARVRKREAMKYGCARLAVRREKLIYNNITFSLLFGGGAKYGSGEDTVFLQDCIRAGLKIYKSPVKVADVKQDSSTWFVGFNEKYYEDKGALAAAALGKNCYLYVLLKSVKTSKGKLGLKNMLACYLKGIKEYMSHKRSK